MKILNHLIAALSLMAALAVTTATLPAAEVNGKVNSTGSAADRLPLAPKGFDVFLLIGQSNMDGRGQVKDLPAELAKPSTEHIIFYRNSRAATVDWMSLAPGYSSGRSNTVPTGQFGCEVTFAPALAAAMPGMRVALIKASEGSTSLGAHWNPGKDANSGSGPQGRCYRTFLDAVNAAVAKLPQGKHRLRGVLWHQGESDAGKSPERYEQMLTHLIARTREDLKAPDLPFVFGELRPALSKNITPAQKAVAEKVLHTAFVSAEGLEGADTLHFNSHGQLELGRRYAAAMAKLLAAVTPTILDPEVVPTKRVAPAVAP